MNTILKKTISIMSAAAIALGAAVTVASAAQASESSSYMIGQTNSYRANGGVSKLEVSGSLNSVAQAWSEKC